MSGARVRVLVVGRDPVTPVGATVERVVEATVVVANAAVVLTRDQVQRIGRVNRDLLLRLSTQGAVLVDAHVGGRAAVGTADCRRSRVGRKVACRCRSALRVGGLLPLLVPGDLRRTGRVRDRLAVHELAVLVLEQVAGAGRAGRRDNKRRSRNQCEHDG